MVKGGAAVKGGRQAEVLRRLNISIHPEGSRAILELVTDPDGELARSNAGALEKTASEQLLLDPIEAIAGVKLKIRHNKRLKPTAAAGKA